MSIKKKTAIALSSLAVAGAVTLGLAAPASAVMAFQGPYSSIQQCQADRTTFISYYPNYVIGSCFRQNNYWVFSVYAR